MTKSTQFHIVCEVCGKPADWHRRIYWGLMGSPNITATTMLIIYGWCDRHDAAVQAIIAEYQATSQDGFAGNLLRAVDQLT